MQNAYLYETVSKKCAAAKASAEMYAADKVASEEVATTSVREQGEQGIQEQMVELLCSLGM